MNTLEQQVLEVLEDRANWWGDVLSIAESLKGYGSDDGEPDDDEFGELFEALLSLSRTDDVSVHRLGHTGSTSSVFDQQCDYLFTLRT